MKLRIVDAKHRITLPEAQPGERYEVKCHGGGVYTVVRADEPAPEAPTEHEDCSHEG
jgi:hypothetical protein